MSRRFCKTISILLTLVLVTGLFPGNLLLADSEPSDEQMTESSSTSEDSFPYAVFAGSTEDDLSFYGWKCNITGDIYSGRDFVFQGSELNMNGCARTSGTVQPSERKENMTGAEEGIEPLLMPMWGDAIKANEMRIPSISPEELSSQDSIDVNGYFYSENDITINGTSFSGDAIIVSKGSITYNVCSLNTEGKVILYSEEGDININGTQIGINGILYAPQGRVTINAYDVTINGRIVADKFSYSGSILNITADPSDLRFLQDITEPTPEITPTEEPTQAPTEEPTETPSPTEEPTVSPSVTTVPTEEPTVEPTEEPTVEPTDIPSDTPTPTEKPLDLETDTDGDLIPDDLEIELGTDPGDPDSDMDGLNDYIEILLGYDPMSDDSDGNGIKDGDEDYDLDGVSNKAELEMGLYIDSSDSDLDGINDGDEISIFNTDPKDSDTDKDGITDGNEVELGKDPLDVSDGKEKREQVYIKDINNVEDPSLYRVEVRMELEDLIESVLDVRDVYKVYPVCTDVYGMKGSPVSFECTEDFDTATITFYYDETKLGEGTNEDDLGILWYDEEHGCFLEQDNVTVDTENNTVTLTADHFSVYFLVDLNMWNHPVLPDYSDILFTVHDEIDIVEWAGREKTLDEQEISSFAWWKKSNGTGYSILARLNGEKILTKDGEYIQHWHYVYDWLVIDDTDEDHDDIPDAMEVQGMYGVDGKTYHSDPNDPDTDHDGLSDSEEMGQISIVTRIDEDHVDIDGNTYSLNEISGEVGFSSVINSMVARVYKPVIPAENGGSVVVFLNRSNPEKSDTDGDGIDDPNDRNRKIPRYVTYNLGGGSYDPLKPHEGYVYVKDTPYNDRMTQRNNNTGYDDISYGGNQSWFDNISFDDDGNINLFIEDGGCGIIAANDVRLYIQNATHTYDWADYYSEVHKTYSKCMGITPIGFHINAPIISPSSICIALSQFGIDSEIQTLNNEDKNAIIDSIKASLDNDCPVILLEDDLISRDPLADEENRDPLWHFYMNKPYCMTFEKTNIRLLQRKMDDSQLLLESTSTRFHHHYVTITGLIYNSETDEYFFRIQSWGSEFYVSFNSLCSYNDASCRKARFIYVERG